MKKYGYNERICLMKEPKAIFAQLTDTGILSDLARLLRDNDPEFPPCEQAYQQAVAALQAALNDSSTLRLEDYLEAWKQEVLAHMVYAGYLGFQANLANFRDPTGNDFVFQDDSINLKEHIMERFPVCLNASDMQRRFRRSLPKALRRNCDMVSGYFIFLNVYGKKLAHYTGYMFGNEFLPWVEPGYQCDEIQTRI